MFKKYLRKNFDNIALTLPNGKSYTNGSILKQVDLLVRAFSCVGLKSEDGVGIHTKNEMHSIATIIACLSYGANFTILNPKENESDIRTKITIAGIAYGLIISETVVEESTTTLNPETFEVICKGLSYNLLTESEKDVTSKQFKTIASLKDERNNFSKSHIDFPENYLHNHRELIYGIVFHNGISKGLFNASKIHHTSIIKGIDDAREFLYRNVKGPVLTLEPFDSLYDIVNGILAPLLNGIHVHIGKNFNIYEMFKSAKKSNAKILYINNKKLEKLLSTLSRETMPLLRYGIFKPLFKLAMRKQFNRLVSNHINHIYVTGRVERKSLFNSISVKYTLLYTMTEVASYIAKKTYKRIPKDIWLTPRLNVLVQINSEKTYGEILLVCDDMFEQYLVNEYTEKALLSKTAVGKFRTEDIGIMKNGKLLIKNKAKNIFTNQKGCMIETGKIRTLALRFDIIKEASIIVKNDKLLLVVEPDFDYIESTKRITSPDRVHEEIRKLKKFVNKHIGDDYLIEQVITINNPDGLLRKNFKIISRYFE